MLRQIRPSRGDSKKRNIINCDSAMYWKGYLIMFSRLTMLGSGLVDIIEGMLVPGSGRVSNASLLSKSSNTENVRWNLVDALCRKAMAQS